MNASINETQYELWIFRKLVLSRQRKNLPKEEFKRQMNVVDEEIKAYGDAIEREGESC